MWKILWSPTFNNKLKETVMQIFTSPTKKEENSVKALWAAFNETVIGGKDYSFSIPTLNVCDFYGYT
jgi:hypothetical protein